MKFIFAAILSLITLFGAVHAQARTEKEVRNDLIYAAKTAVNIYKENGMAGLIGYTQNCYGSHKNKFYCVYFDLASRHIDQVMIADAAKHGMRFPSTTFFEDELFGARITPVLQEANMSQETGNAYLSGLTKTINKLVDTNLFDKKK